MCPPLLVPDLTVIPLSPESATVRLSAELLPSVVVPINKPPLESMRSASVVY